MIANERGMTVVEVLVAVAIIGIGLTAVATGMTLGTSGITTGQQETIATFLAEQRIEDVKAFALSTNPLQGFANVTTANFPAEDYGTIAGGYDGYRRATAVAIASATMRVVTVNVFYRPIGVAATNPERQVTLSAALRTR
jgi:prepilin-type N-terminal cleavage/methylation domain-containing protein